MFSLSPKRLMSERKDGPLMFPQDLNRRRYHRHPTATLESFNGDGFTGGFFWVPIPSQEAVEPSIGLFLCVQGPRVVSC